MDLIELQKEAEAKRKKEFEEFKKELESSYVSDKESNKEQD